MSEIKKIKQIKRYAKSKTTDKRRAFKNDTRFKSRK